MNADQAQRRVTAYLTALARTAVPLVAGWLIAWALRHGVDLRGHASEVTVGVGFLYYSVAGFLERFVHPAFGWLLGIAKTPVYRQVAAAARTSGATSQLTVAIHADTTAFRKELARLADDLGKVGTGKVTKKEAGYGLVEMVFAVFVLIILVLVIVFLADKIH